MREEVILLSSTSTSSFHASFVFFFTLSLSLDPPFRAVHKSTALLLLLPFLSHPSLTLRKVR